VMTAMPITPIAQTPHAMAATVRARWLTTQKR